jgi:hypothetical protein
LLLRWGITDVDIDKLAAIREALYKHRRDSTEIKGPTQLPTAANDISNEQVVWECKPHKRILDGLDDIINI